MSSGKRFKYYLTKIEVLPGVQLLDTHNYLPLLQYGEDYCDTFARNWLRLVRQWRIISYGHHRDSGIHEKDSCKPVR